MRKVGVIFWNEELNLANENGWIIYSPIDNRVFTAEEIDPIILGEIKDFLQNEYIGDIDDTIDADLLTYPNGQLGYDLRDSYDR